MTHTTVLLQTAVEALKLEPDSVVVDCTLGAAGHAQEILRHLGTEGVFVGFDADPVAIEAAKQKLTGQATKHFVTGNFNSIALELASRNLQPTAILADLGWRSDQFETGGKGFSFGSEEPLLMTYGDPKAYPFTAHDIANVWEEESIADIIYGYGEERHSRRIARAIIAARQQSEIKTAKQLAEIVTKALPLGVRHGRIHPATKTFQAFRIAVNNELGVLETLLNDGFSILAPGGRMAVITFHSLEDRIVKHYFKKLARDQKATLITKKPITADKDELTANPRARSAKLRIIEKL